MEISQEPTGAPLTSRAWFESSISEFYATDPIAVLGKIVAQSDFAVLQSQRDAWLDQINFLRGSLDGLEGSVFFEFNIPRMGRRVDVVLLIGAVVFVVEFKVGEVDFGRGALDQVWDYALDLKNFHEASHKAVLVPILVATEAAESAGNPLVADSDGVYRPLSVHPAGFRPLLTSVLTGILGAPVEHSRWSQSS
jgi:hypothetical protein